MFDSKNTAEGELRSAASGVFIFFLRYLHGYKMLFGDDSAVFVMDFSNQLPGFVIHAENADTTAVLVRSFAPLHSIDMKRGELAMWFSCHKTLPDRQLTGVIILAPYAALEAVDVTAFTDQDPVFVKLTMNTVIVLPHADSFFAHYSYSSQCQTPAEGFGSLHCLALAQLLHKPGGKAGEYSSGCEGELIS
jgi:hypothetical protein